MILVDSSGWIEYLAGRPNADKFAPYIEGEEPLVTSAIQLYEIYKVIRRDISEERAIESISALRYTTIEPLAESLALEAADLSLDPKQAPMARGPLRSRSRPARASVLVLRGGSFCPLAREESASALRFSARSPIFTGFQHGDTPLPRTTLHFRHLCCRQAKRRCVLKYSVPSIKTFAQGE